MPGFTGQLHHFTRHYFARIWAANLRIVKDAEHTKSRFIGNSSHSKLRSPSNLECSLANAVRIMPSRGYEKEMIRGLFNESPR